jgi:phosphomevalonate kinase
MTKVRASAPGKALVSGEYVVLAGAPAISMALDRRVSVSVAETTNRCNEFEAPGLIEGRWLFADRGNGGLHWQDGFPSESFRLFEAVWQRCSLSSHAALSVCIDSRNLRDNLSGTKLGLGSSSAVAVALAAALSKFSDPQINIVSVARDAHREFQGGRGSGADIATSFNGGVIEFSMNSKQPSVDVGWPAGLACRFLWSGKPAVTTDQLRKFLPAGRDKQERASFLALAELAAEVAASWSGASASATLASLAAYTAALKDFSEDCDLGIFTAGHREMADLASSCGIVYKPCGAGGGDIGIALSLDKTELQEFCSGVPGTGFTVLDVHPDWRGVQVDKENKV